MLYWHVAYVLFMEGLDVMNPMELEIKCCKFSKNADITYESKW